MITSLADKYGKTPAQIVIRWHLELGNVVIPKSVTPSRIAENFDVFDFDLDAEDVDAITRPEPRRAHRARPGPLQPLGVVPSPMEIRVLPGCISAAFGAYL